jgi:tetratricopeptide (TPR) repeat protein
MKKLIALVLIFKCTVACSQNLRAEIDSLQRVLLQTQKPAAKIDIMSDLGSDYGYAGETDSVRFISAKMLKIATDAKEDSLMSAAYIYLGYYYNLTSDYKQALEFYLKALALAEQSKSGNFICFAAKETGANYKDLKAYPEALKYLRKSASFLNATTNPPVTSNRTYCHLAETFLGLNETDSALRYVQLANEVTVKEKDPYGFARMLYIFASVYKARGDADLAESYYKKCLAFSDAQNIYLPYTTAAIAYGHYLFDLKQYNLSKEYALKGFIKAKQAQNKLEMINASLILRKAYYAIGQKDSSYYYSDIKDAYSDTVFNEQQRNQIQKSFVCPTHKRK